MGPMSSRKGRRLFLRTRRRGTLRPIVMAFAVVTVMTLAGFSVVLWTSVQDPSAPRQGDSVDPPRLYDGGMRPPPSGRAEKGGSRWM
jgi:hypothetical protein